MDAKIRRLEVNLVTMGTGVAVFGMWTLIRAALTLFVFDDEIAGFVTPQIKIFVYAAVGIVVAIICSFQIYVGLSARGEGKGKRKSIVYLIFAGIGVVIDVSVSAPQFFTMFTSGGGDWVTVLATLIVEVTSITCTIIMMTSSISLRKIRKSTKPVQEGGTV